MAAVVDAYDVTHSNLSRVPRGAQLAGYTTGSSDIRWTAADWAAHPGAIRIDQDFAASDPSADVLDVESGAATFGDCPVWSKKALADFNAGVRPGQRRPAIYFSASKATQVINALIAGGVTSGVGLWVADWGIGRARAAQMVTDASGPFPIIGVQYANAGAYDIDVFSAAWLAETSHGGGTPTPAPPPVAGMLHAWVPGGP